MRIKLIIYFVIAISLLLLARVYILSIKSNTYYEELSKKNYIKTKYKVAPRGAILDRNGNYLAINKIGFSLSIRPHMRKYKHINDLKKILTKINRYFPQYKYNKLLKRYKKYDSPYKHEFIKIIDYIPYDDFIKLYHIFNMEKYVKIESANKRFYPYKNIAAHILGYTSRVNINDIKKDKTQSYHYTTGKSGLERYYNKKLQGNLAKSIVYVNAHYEVVKTIKDEIPKSNNITTAIDIKLQKFIHNLFDKRSGAVVVMDIKNGEILSAGSFPEFNNNIFVNGVSQKVWKTIIESLEHPFTNKIVNGLYPPGSTIKMGVALAFLENKISRYYSVNCKSDLTIGKRKFRCWKGKGHGRTGFRKAIRESCDDFFYKGSLKIGINKISKTLDKFGFGNKTGIDQPNEFKGVNPNKFWKKKRYKQPWYLGETVVSAIGQGYFLVTPIQIARYTAALATGFLPTPHILKDNNLTYNIDLKIKKEYLKLIQRGMFDVIHNNKGTGHKYIFSNISIAAKTGTAQVIGIPQEEKKRIREDQLKYFTRSHAWLTSYAPYKNPRYVVTILVEHGGHGGSAAGAMLTKIYQKMKELGYMKKY